MPNACAMQICTAFSFTAGMKRVAALHAQCFEGWLWINYGLTIAGSIWIHLAYWFMMKAISWPQVLWLLLVKHSHWGCWTEEKAQAQETKVLFLVLQAACQETLEKSIPSSSRIPPSLKPDSSKNTPLKVFIQTTFYLNPLITESKHWTVLIITETELNHRWK